MVTKTLSILGILPTLTIHSFLSLAQLNPDPTKMLEARHQALIQVADVEGNQKLELNKREIARIAEAKRVEAVRLATEQAALAAQAAQKASLSRRSYSSPPAASKSAVSGSCEDWIAAAGIADPVSARILINKESGCNPYARNASSGACGIAQELPCGKSGCSLGDGACQIRWMNGYVLGRYGSWGAAVAFHISHNYY